MDRGEGREGRVTEAKLGLAPKPQGPAGQVTGCSCRGAGVGSGAWERGPEPGRS